MKLVDRKRLRRLLLPPTLPRVPPPQVAVDDPLPFDKEFGRTSILAPIITAHLSSSLPHLLLAAAGDLGVLWSQLDKIDRKEHWPVFKQDYSFFLDILDSFPIKNAINC